MTKLTRVAGSEPPKSLRSLPHVHFVYLWKVPKFLQNAPRVFFVVVGPLKAIIQSFSVLHALFWRLPYTAEYIIVQVSRSRQGGIIDLAAKSTLPVCLRTRRPFRRLLWSNCSLRLGRRSSSLIGTTWDIVSLP